MRQGRGPDVDLAEALEMRILRTGARLNLTEFGGRMGPSVGTVHGRLRAWARAMQGSEVLTPEATSVLADALRQDDGGLPLGRHLPPGVFTRRAGWEGSIWRLGERVSLAEAPKKAGRVRYLVFRRFLGLRER